MDLWFSEFHTKNVKFSVKVTKQLYSGKSEFQEIDVFESPEFGRFLTLDGYMMLTEKDEFIYHEMITHVPMAVHPNPKNILVIGGGDGGTVRELLKYDCVESIDLVEIDEEVVEVCKKYLPQTAACLDNKDGRINFYYEDGLKFIRHCENMYDIIIVDSTDPFGPGEGLFTMEFYGNCEKALREDGIMVNQHESPFYNEDACAHWLFGFATKKSHPLRDFDPSRWEKFGIKTKYYTTHLHKGAFYVPAYVEELLSDVE